MIRPANEARFEARWKLGQLLAKVERSKGRSWMSQSGTPKFRNYLKDLGLNKNRANECERRTWSPSYGRWRHGADETPMEN